MAPLLPFQIPQMQRRTDLESLPLPTATMPQELPAIPGQKLRERDNANLALHPIP